MRYTPFIGNSIEGISDTTAYVSDGPISADHLVLRPFPATLSRLLPTLWRKTS